MATITMTGNQKNERRVVGKANKSPLEKRGTEKRRDGKLNHHKKANERTT